jgi:hypothetical protein
MLLGMMRRVFALTLVLAAAVAGGCGAAAVPRAAEPPPPASEPRTRADPTETETPKLIAPPPAYGNKVVMAQGPTVTHHD